VVRNYTIFRIGEPHGRITPRVEELVECSAASTARRLRPTCWGGALVEAGQNKHGQRRDRGDRADLGRLPAQRQDPPLPDPARGRSGCASAGARLYAREDPGRRSRSALARASEATPPRSRRSRPSSCRRPAPNPRGDIQRPSMAQDILRAGAPRSTP